PPGRVPYPEKEIRLRRPLSTSRPYLMVKNWVWKHPAARKNFGLVPTQMLHRRKTGSVESYLLRRAFFCCSPMTARTWTVSPHLLRKFSLPGRHKSTSDAARDTASALLPGRHWLPAKLWAEAGGYARRPIAAQSRILAAAPAAASVDRVGQRLCV